MNYTKTHAGNAILTHHLCSIGNTPNVNNGTIALGVLIDDKGKPSSWCLFWEWGADWNSFVDGHEYDFESLDGWEADAIAEAIEAIPDHLKDEISDDMQWFEDWAYTARKTISYGYQ